MGMDNNSYVDRLRAMLHRIFPEAEDKKSNTQVIINCPICAQQGDPDYKKHMYISLGADNKPPMFNCFRRSGHSGLLTLSAVERLSNYSQYIDTGLMSEIDKMVKKGSYFNGFRPNQNLKLPLFLPDVKYSKISRELLEHKRKYISNRLGIEFTYEMLKQNKIVLSLYDFLRANKIEYLTYDKRITDVLDQWFIGFLTQSNTSLIMRNTLDDKIKVDKRTQVHNTRYLSYKIRNDVNTSYYVIPSSCDILKPIEVHMAEGAFDILSVYYNINHQDQENKIYASIGSKAYLNLIKYFLVQIGLIDVRFHIYIDSTIEKNILEEIKWYMDPLQIPVWIHINTFQGEKDFGVPKDRIAHYHYKL